MFKSPNIDNVQMVDIQVSKSKYPVYKCPNIFKYSNYINYINIQIFKYPNIQIILII